MRKFVTAALALLAAAPAAAQGLASDPKLDRVLAGRAAGAPVRCIPLRPNTRSQIVPGEAIVYRDGDQMFVNRPTVGLEWLERDSILVSRPVVSSLCANEPVQLIDRVGGFQRGNIVLGEFVPYTKPGKARRR